MSGAGTGSRRSAEGCAVGATERAYRTIGGVPLWYLRGSGVVRNVTVYSQRSFEQKLDAFSFELQRVTPRAYGRVVYIATAGAYVNRPGAHGLGRAFDLDAVRWRYRTSAPYWSHHRSASLADRRRYLAVDALLRRRFKYVLDGWFNAAHSNHIHVDDLGGALVLNKRFRSDTVFVQAVCNNFIGTRLVLDGLWGPATERAFAVTRRRLRVAGPMVSQAWRWRTWLYRVAVHGLHNRRF